MHNMLLQVVKDMRLGEQYPRHVPGILLSQSHILYNLQEHVVH